MNHIYPYRGVYPTIASDCFVAPTASVIGDVLLGQGANVWYGVTLRGDVEKIRIGAMTNIQDGTVGHVTTDRFGLYIGARVTVGHNVTLHACTVADDVLVGMGSTVMDGATIESFGMLAAGALLSPGKVVRAGELWAGVPARKVRDVTNAERDYILWSATHYYKLAQEHKNAIAEHQQNHQ